MLTRRSPAHGHVLGLSLYGFHCVAYTRWGEAAAGEVAVCVHGLTRNGRDFDVLGEALSDGRQVYCPDVVGRGASDWLPAAELYGYPQYMSDMTALIARTGAAQVDWIGTSMGGLIGMMMAAQPKTPIRRLVINDVGPFVPASALHRLAAYVGQDPHFVDFEAALAHIREIHAPFGPLSEDQWRHLAEHSLRPDPVGGYRFAYDPAIAKPLEDPEAIEDVDLWQIWDAIACPVLVLRGADSDILPADTAQEMTQRGPCAELVEFPGIGHAPALMARDQVDTVLDWLARTKGAGG